jgi:putative two-component system response regulator
MNILIVDDDAFTLDALEHLLRHLGHQTIRAANGQQAIERLRHEDIRLVITDWNMPEMSGTDLCRIIRSDEINGYVYLIMLTGHGDAQSRRDGLNAGADDFLFKPLEAEDLMVCLKTAERILALETRDVALFALAKLAESRDPETGAHVERVQSYSRLLAQHLTAEVKKKHGINAEFIRLLHQTSALHDLGKVAIPDSILLKPGSLTPDEFEVMKAHAVLGSQTLDAALHKFPNAGFLRMARDIAISHHEKFDGSGYPAALAGDNIPFCGRLVALADVYDALTSRRVYKEAMVHDRARQFILAGRGRSFDPDVVDAFTRSESQFVEILSELSEKPRPAIPATGATAVQPSTDGDCSILIVEDSPMMLRSLTKLLATTGHRVRGASNIQQAMQVFIEHCPEVIVSDWEMPGGSGVELCQRVRSHAAAKPPHFIMLTSHSEQQSVLQAYTAGINDFVVKPYHPEELIARVKAGLRVSELHTELARKTERLLATNSQLKVMNDRLDRLSITDELTGLFNRRHAMTRLQEHWLLSERYGTNLSVAAIDIDHFKQVNDTYGHEAGDVVLKQVASTLRECTRQTDIVCRVGGEEFLILFPSQTREEAIQVALRCRAAVEKLSLQFNNAELKITISGGVAMRAATMQQSGDLLRTADELLYDAKHAGRNRVLPPESQEAASLKTIKQLSVLNQITSMHPASNDLDINLIASRCGGDAQFAEGIVELFKTQAPLELDRLAAALLSADIASFQRIAHTLKSMTAYVTADAAAEHCRQLEEMAKLNQLGEAGPLLQLLQAELHQVLAWIANRAESNQSVRAA